MRSQAWITGAHGFIGRHLARHLARSGSHVVGLGHGGWPAGVAASWGVARWLNGDISASNLDHLRQAHGAPDVLFHLAGGSSVGMAMSNPHEDFSRTVLSTSELLEWLRLHSPATRLVAVSSAAVYGAGYTGGITEDSAVRPFSPYGTHKFLMEELCRSYAVNFGLQVALPRLFSVYGAGLRKQLLWDLCKKMETGDTIELGGTGDELRDWIEVQDVAAALLRVAQMADDRAPVVNLAFGQATSVREIASLMLQAWFGRGGELPGVVFSGISRPGDPFSLVADIARMRASGIVCSISLTQGIVDYVDWYRRQIELVD